MHTKTEKTAAFGRLLDVLDRLRVECPWDRRQTMLSLRNQTIEECFELMDAVVAGDLGAIKKELGDLLLHVVFYARIASEQGSFDIADVADALCEKLIYRHPHVFGSEQAADAERVVENWEALKQREKEGNRTLLSGVPTGMPALPKAARIQDKVRAVGFDWNECGGGWDGVLEDFLAGAVSSSASVSVSEGSLSSAEASVSEGSLSSAEVSEGCSSEGLELGFGDLLFSVVNAARHHGVNPDLALERTNRKFIDCFTRMELAIRAQGLEIQSLSPQELNCCWEEAKCL